MTGHVAHGAVTTFREPAVEVPLILHEIDIRDADVREAERCSFSDEELLDRGGGGSRGLGHGV